MDKKDFDLAEGEALKELGMLFAATSRTAELDIARRIAREIALKSPDHTCDADQVQARLIEMGIDLGNSAGSIFKSQFEWAWTGRFRKSARKTNHSRLIRVWKLRKKSK
jgi:hypothetical protein